MVVLEGTQMATTTLGGPYAQGAPALKIVQKRFLGLHQWLSPVYGKEIKEQLVSVTLKYVIPIKASNDEIHTRHKHNVRMCAQVRSFWVTYLKKLNTMWDTFNFF